MRTTLMERITGRVDPIHLLEIDEQSRRDELLLKKLDELKPKYKEKDDWGDTFEFDLSEERNKELIPLPTTVVEINSLSVFHLDDDVTLTINGETDIECTTTITLRDRKIDTVALTNSSSSGYVRIYFQGKRKNVKSFR